MSKNVRIVQHGDTQVVTMVLSPGMHRLSTVDGIYIEISVQCYIDAEEKFLYGSWTDRRYLVDTLRIAPTRWQRFKAFFWRTEVVPRAVLVTKK